MIDQFNYIKLHCCCYTIKHLVLIEKHCLKKVVTLHDMLCFWSYCISLLCIITVAQMKKYMSLELKQECHYAHNISKFVFISL